LAPSWFRCASFLATSLWRRIVRDHDTGVGPGEFTRLGLYTVPAALGCSTPALGVWLRSIGT
jgi:arsenical pump membrane protein